MSAPPSGVGIPGIGERLPVERPDDCVSRTLSAVGTGLVAGGIAGAVTANWANVPPVLQNKPWPALKQTGMGMSYKQAAYSCTSHHCLQSCDSNSSMSSQSHIFDSNLKHVTACGGVSVKNVDVFCRCHHGPVCFNIRCSWRHLCCCGLPGRDNPRYSPICDLIQHYSIGSTL